MSSTETIDATNLFRAFDRTVASGPNHPLFIDPVSGERWSREEFARRAGRLGAELKRRGVRGRTVGLLMGNRLEFFQIDMAVLLAGGIPVSLYPTSSPLQIAQAVADAGIGLLFVDQVRLQAAQQAVAQLPSGSLTLAVLDLSSSGAGIRESGILHFGDLATAADDAIAVHQRAQEARSQDLLTLIYTSGTTGQPKAAALTHGNFLAATEALRHGLGLREADRVISWLPHAHVAERVSHYYCALVVGLEVTVCADSQRLPALLREVEPTWFGAIPRFWEKLMAGAQAQLAGLPPEHRTKVDEAMADTLALHRMRECGEEPSPEFAARQSMSDAALLRPLRASLGLSKARSLATGSAPTPRSVLQFFASVGLPLDQIYGATETCMSATLERPGASRLGSAGQPVHGIELRIAADDEVQVRGLQVLRSYWRRPESTREAIDADGWYSTGDLGRIDEDGFLWITGRKKDLIINSSGQNMSPQNIQATLCEHSPLIAHAVVIGDARPFNTALLVLHPAPAVPAPTDGAVAQALCHAVAQANEQLARVEQIKRFRIVLDAWQPGGEELTPTMKLRRAQVLRRYAQDIEAMYAASPTWPVLEPRLSAPQS